MFLDEFRQAKWPGNQFEGLIEAEKCKQGPSDTIDSYYERFKGIMDHLQWSEGQMTEWFISGLFDNDTRKVVNLHDYPVRTLETVKKFALDYVKRKEMGEVLEGRRNAMPATASYAAGVSRGRRGNAFAPAVASTSVAGVGNAAVGRGRGNARTYTQAPGTSQARGGGQARGGQARGGGQPRGGGQSRGAAAPAVNYVGQSGVSQRRSTADAWMRANGIRGCLACLKQHRMQHDFATCTQMCPFCDKQYIRGERRHLAAECPRRPRQRFELHRRVNQAQARV